MNRCRSVSNRSGNRLLIVTLSAATSKDSPFSAAVSPALAALERAIPGRGVVTIAEVMLTMRPKWRARIPSTTAAVRSTAAMRLPSRAASHVAWSKELNGPGEGPALLLIRMSGSGHAWSRAVRPSGVVTSAQTG
jgi:hypothetical protein